MEISVLKVNRVDPDQTPCSMVSDLGLHCFSVSLLWYARLKWVQITYGINVIKGEVGNWMIILMGCVPVCKFLASFCT